MVGEAADHLGGATLLEDLRMWVWGSVHPFLFSLLPVWGERSLSSLLFYHHAFPTVMDSIPLDLYFFSPLSCFCVRGIFFFVNHCNRKLANTEVGTRNGALMTKKSLCLWNIILETLQPWTGKKITGCWRQSSLCSFTRGLEDRNS